MTENYQRTIKHIGKGCYEVVERTGLQTQRAEWVQCNCSVKDRALSYTLAEYEAGVINRDIITVTAIIQGYSQ